MGKFHDRINTKRQRFEDLLKRGKLSPRQRQGIRIAMSELDDFQLLVIKALLDFPELEAGSFSKLPNGSIDDKWAKEVIEWRRKWFGADSDESERSNG